MTSPDKKKDWIFGLAGMAVGSIGAFIESWQLRGDLNHRYPFKIMSTPPPEYYMGVADTIASFAPFFAIIGGITALVLLRRHKILAGIVPVIICPFAYIVGLWYLVSTGPYKDELNNVVNYDSTAAVMRHGEFYAGALNMLLFSVLVYLVFGLLSFGINRLLQRQLF